MGIDDFLIQLVKYCIWTPSVQSEKNMKLDLCQLSISYSGYDADKLKSPVIIPKIKANRVGVFHILEDQHTLVKGFKARSG